MTNLGTWQPPFIDLPRGRRRFAIHAGMRDLPRSPRTPGKGVRLVRAGRADQPGPRQRVQALTAKERTVRGPDLLHEVLLPSRYFAPRDDRALIGGQVGQRGSDQVGVRSAGLVTDQALGSLRDLVTRRLTKVCSVETTLDVFGKGRNRPEPPECSKSSCTASASSTFRACGPNWPVTAFASASEAPRRRQARRRVVPAAR